MQDLYPILEGLFKLNDPGKEELKSGKPNVVTRITDQFSFVDSRVGSLISESDILVPGGGDHQRIFIYCKKSSDSFENLCAPNLSKRFGPKVTSI